MRVLLLHLDGAFPNLALMRLAAHHRVLGHTVELQRGTDVELARGTLFHRPDLVFASVVFERTRPLAERLLELRPDAVVSGPSWPGGPRLEELGVSCGPDYRDYPEWTSSLGYTQRGCRLRCPFCVVPRLEGPNRSVATVPDVWRGADWPRELVLLDGDFFGQPEWRERVAEIRGGGFRVSFCQGINARLVDEEVAAAVASVDYRDNAMRVRRLYTAWDRRRDERAVLRGLRLLIEAGVRPGHLLVYMLIGNGEDHGDRDYRRRKLRELGVAPYPMLYRRTSELLGFQRWVRSAYDKSISWKRWVRARYQPRGIHLWQKGLPFEEEGDAA